MVNMISNTFIHDIDNIKNDVDFDSEVESYIDKKGFVRRRQLIDHLIESHKEEKKYSRPSVERKLAILIKTGALVIVKHPELEKYGIKETDRRASYLISKNTLKMKKNLDKTFRYLDSADPATKKLILEEISRYETKYVLDPYHLDIFVDHMDAKDDELVNSLLVILFRYIDKKDIKPSHNEKFVEKLKSILKHYKVSPNEYPLLRRHITWLLGYYRDRFVIDQLKIDAETFEDPSSVINDYCDQLIAPFIDEHSLELFNFQIELILKGKERASEFISQIKDEACNPKPRCKEF